MRTALLALLLLGIAAVPAMAPAEAVTGSFKVTIRMPSSGSEVVLQNPEFIAGKWAIRIEGQYFNNAFTIQRRAYAPYPARVLIEPFLSVNYLALTDAVIKANIAGTVEIVAEANWYPGTTTGQYKSAVHSYGWFWPKSSNFGDIIWVAAYGNGELIKEPIWDNTPPSFTRMATPGNVAFGNTQSEWINCPPNQGTVCGPYLTLVVRYTATASQNKVWLPQSLGSARADDGRDLPSAAWSGGSCQLCLNPADPAASIVFRPRETADIFPPLGYHPFPTKRQFSVAALAPTSIGLTSKARPVVYFFVSDNIAADVAVTVSLIDAATTKVLSEAAVTPPVHFGVNAFDLGKAGDLLADVVYRWVVAVDKKPLASGLLRRIDKLTPELEAEIADAGDLELAFIYAEAGLWYDAVAAISSLITKTPASDELRRLRGSLAAQVGLDIGE